MKKQVLLTAFIIFSCAQFTFGQNLQINLPTNTGVFTSYPVTGGYYSWETVPYESYKDVSSNTQFRIKFPPGYVKGSGTKYPIVVFFHGAGEFGTDNRKQLVHGGQRTHDAIQSSEFPGIALYPQKAVNDQWGSVFPVLKILNAVISNADVDPDRIYIHGLSAGGKATWIFLDAYGTCVAAAAPMSQSPLFQVSNSNPGYLSRKECTPIWLSQGGNDKVKGASPADANQIVRVLRNNGSYIRYSYYPTGGHGIWNNTYNSVDPVTNTKDFFTWFLAQKLNNIHVFFEEKQHCEDGALNLVLGARPGHSGYQWRKDGVVIAGATTNKISITEPGTYEVRFTRVSPSGGVVWPGIGQQTPWSDPVIISLDRDKTPVITISNKNHSVNLPALNGSTSVDIVASPNQSAYQWYRDINVVQSGIDSVYSASTAGYYGAKVREAQAQDFFIDNLSDYDGDGTPEAKEVPLQFRPAAPRCFSDLSNLITVTTENLPGVPNKPKNVFLTLSTPSSVLINWDDNATNELGYEIYRAVNSGGPYTLIEITDPRTNQNPQSFIDNDIDQNTTYYYVMRAVNEKGGSDYTTEKSISTILDTQAPSTSQLNVLRWNANYVELGWTAATDNYSVLLYNVYLDGNLYTSISDTKVKVSGLSPGLSYQFYVEAVDEAGNVSSPSNIVTKATVKDGVSYYYYEGVWDLLPDFDQLTPVASGIIPNVSLTPKLKNDYFGFLYEAIINIPTTGTYTFYTSSDDGSKLYINGNQIVDNDGLHGNEEQSGQVVLSAGQHNFVVTFFEKGGGQGLTVSWQGPGISKQLIPDSAFSNNYSSPNGPNAPSDFSASPVAYNRVDLSWVDDVSNETGFEIYRSGSLNGPFSILSTLPVGANAYSDNSVSASASYFYQVAAINAQGSSIKPNQNYRVFMPLNENITDISNNPVTNTISKTAVYSTTDFVEGGSSLNVLATNTFVNVDNGRSFIRASFSERSISIWFKASDVISNQTLFEEGNSTNGIAMRVNGGNLQLGVQNSHSIVTLSTPVTANIWNHAVGVFSYGKLSLYLNGVLVDSNPNVGYTVVSTHDNPAGLGGSNSSDAFDGTTSGKIFKGFIDAFMIFTGTLNSNDVKQLYNFPKSLASVTTPAPPTVTAPSALTANGISSSQVDLIWNDNSDNETGFEIYRTTSPADIGWILVHTAAPGTTSYSNIGLDGNSTYYYKIRAIYNAQSSAYSNIASGSTVNNGPVFTNVFDISVRPNSTLNLLIKTIDPDGDALQISASGVPAFGTFTDNLDGTAGLNFSTGSSCPDGICSYMISLTVTDGSISAQKDFTLSISNNNDPVLAPIANQSMDEGRILDVGISVKDVDNDVKVVVLGSSTAAGVGAIPADSAWVKRLENYLMNISNSATVVNMALSGFTTEDIRATGSTPSPDITRNITAAIAQNPDIIIVNMPSNNVKENIPITTTIAHYNEIKTLAEANGITILFTTTQPRNFDGETLLGGLTPSQGRQLLVDEAQAVRDNFGSAVIDIYDELTDFSNDKRIKTLYNSGDNIHINNKGHAYIFSTVKSKLINYAGINNPDIQVNNLPSFATVIKNNNGTNAIRFKPGYYNAGTYSEIEVFALDGKGGLASNKFNLSVINTTASSSVYINFSGETASPTNPWRKTGAHGVGSISNIIDDKGFNSGWTLNFATGTGVGWLSTESNNGMTGIYPAEVMRTRFKFASANISDFVEMEISGLSEELMYDLVLFGSRNETDGQVINTDYTVEGVTKSLNIVDNTSQTVIFEDVAADVQGKIKIRVAQGSSTATPAAYLNSIIVNSYFDSGLPPTAPSNLNASLNNANKVVLTWSDNSDNERRFVIYRSTSINGVYDSLGSVSPNIKTFTDNKNVLGHITYYYKIAAKNNNGTTFSGVKSILTLNNNPQLFTNLMYAVPSGKLTSLLISGADEDGDLLTYTGENLPSYLEVKSNPDGTGTLEFNPESYDVGSFSGSKIYAGESYLGFDENQVFFNVVSGEFDEHVYINFSPLSGFNETPFNTIGTAPVAGASYPSLLDIFSTPTAMNMVVGNNWTGAGVTGATTLTNTGVIIDTVLLTNWSTTATAALSITGLDNSKLYNLTFFGSDVNSSSATRYSVGAVSVNLITGGNTTATAQLNGISPTANKIDINVQKINSSVRGHISALLIQSYNPNIVPAPSSLVVIGGKNNQAELRWNDNSGNESGFEIYRKELPSGSISLVTTTSSNQTSYINSGLTANKTYEYRIRAISPFGNSNYSNTAFGSTYEFQVKVNVSGPPAAVTGTSPDVTNTFPNWVNLYTSVENGLTFSNLKNDAGASTIIDLTLDEIGVGFDRNLGATTGSNSGVYPDAVMQSFYFYEANDDLGQWTIKDLNPNYAYNITLTGSCLGWLLDAFNAKGITEYIINNKSLFLDTRDNTSRTVTFYNVFPDAENKIILNARAAKIPGVNYGLINAIIIQGYSKIDRTEGENFFTYYALNNANIAQTSNWNTRITGTGTALTGFNQPGLEYVIDENTTVNAGSNLTIGGSGTLLKVKSDSEITLNAAVTNLQVPELVVYDGVTFNVSSTASASPAITLTGGGLSIRNNGILDFDSLQLVLNGTGSVNKGGETGRIAVNNGSLTLSNTSNADQHLYFLHGRDSVKDFTINNSGTGAVILEEKLHAKNSVKIQDGVLNSNGNLVLVSDSKATANLLKIESGSSIVGNVEYQRYWERPIGTAGFFYIGSPILNQTVGDWVGEFKINGLGSSGWKNLNYWNEPLNNWVAVGSASSPLLPGKGINAFIFSQDFSDQYIRYNNIGPIQQGNYTFDLSYNTGTNPGWNLVANPFPCAIDWSTIPWSDPAFVNRVDAAVYLWDQSSGSYITWTPAVGNLESPIIASGQGFFVHTNEDNASPVLLAVTEDIKVNSQPTFLRQSAKENILQIIAQNSAQKQDVAYVSLFEDATFGFDSHLDGKKLASSYVNLSSLTAFGDNLAVNALPTDQKEYSVPLVIKSTVYGEMSFTFKNVASFNENYDMVLVDQYKDVRSDIKDGAVYTYSIAKDDTASFGSNRFIIEINKAPDKVLIYGDIMSRYNRPITGVSVVAENDRGKEPTLVESDSLGFFTMKLIGVNSYDFNPTKSGVYNSENVNFADYVALNWLIKGWNRNLSDTEFIAADIDRSGTIDKVDLKTLRNILSGYRHSANNTFNYRFISDDSNLLRNGLTYSLDAGLSIIPNLYVTKALKIQGIIPGDVVIGSKESNNRESDTTPVVFILGSPVKSGDVLHIPVYGRNFVNIAGFSVLGDELIQEVAGDAIHFTENAMHANDTDKTIIWTNEPGTGSTIADGTLLFNIVVPQDANISKEVAYSLTSRIHVALNGDMKQVNLKIEDLSQFGENGNIFLGAYPNPFTDHVAFRLKIEKPEIARFYLYSSNGALIHEASLKLNVGMHDLDLKKDLGYYGQISPGMTIFRIQVGDMIITDKLIRN